MRNGGGILKVLAAAAVVVFAGGVLQLWTLRFDSGDIYRPYSSLRTDPLSVRALYESLEQLPEVSVRRNFKPLRRLTRSDADTLFYLGVDSETIPPVSQTPTSGPAARRKTQAGAIHDFASNGGRVVISFAPRAGGRVDVLRLLFRGSDGIENLDDLTSSNSSITDLGLSVKPEERAEWKKLHNVPATGSDPLSSAWPDVPWHGSLYFGDLTDDWKVIFSRDGKPVIVERAFGSGSIVLCADTYFLSNQALVSPDGRNAHLLAWLAGSRSVLFDETHLGSVHKEGIASLGRRHGLTNLFFVLLVIASLYVWKSCVSVLPRDPEQIEELGGREVSGKSSSVGLHHLLRKCIPTSEILGVCMKHWAASAPTKRPKQREDMDKILAIVAVENSKPRKHRDPVRAYTDICRILAERKK